MRLRALEGMAADRLQGLDQRLRRLETLPAAVGRLQQDSPGWPTSATAGGPTAPAVPAGVAADLAPVYEELDSVAELVSSHHGAANQSLERVRTLERAVLEMRRHLERNQAEQARRPPSELTTAKDRHRPPGGPPRGRGTDGALRARPRGRLPPDAKRATPLSAALPEVHTPVRG